MAYTIQQPIYWFTVKTFNCSASLDNIEERPSSEGPSQGNDNLEGQPTKDPTDNKDGKNKGDKKDKDKKSTYLRESFP